MTWCKKTSNHINYDCYREVFTLERRHILKRKGISHFIKIILHSHLVIVHDYE